MPKETLALNLARSKRWEDITQGSFQRLARKIGVEEEWVMGRVEFHLGQIFQAWKNSEERFGFDGVSVKKFGNHWRRIPLLRDLVVEASSIG